MPLFSTGQVVTAAQLNAAVGGYVEKAADQSVTSSTVLVNDTHLFYAIGAVGTYVVDFYLFGTSATNAAGDLGIAFSFPTGTATATAVGPDTSLASGTVSSAVQFGQGAVTSGALFQVLGLSTSPVLITAHVVLKATATGTLRLMWAQQASSASASTLKAGSHMIVRQVA